MASLLKNIYSKAFFKKFIQVIKGLNREFSENSFLSHIYQDDWEEKALKQRMRHITLGLKEHLTGSFHDNVNFLLALIPRLEDAGFKANSLEFIFLPDFIEVYGIEEFLTSIEAIETITQFITCEFAVRPFLIKYEMEMMLQMKLWSKHPHPMVRRLASEGSRPKLPWAQAVPFLKNDPRSILPILENLKTDETESVRRSVANCLNDISKDHPDLVIRLLKNWKQDVRISSRLIKHAARTLLKQGNSEIMDLFGFKPNSQIKIENFEIITPVVRIGSNLEFSFELYNQDETSSNIRLEYAIFFLRANGSWSKRVFYHCENSYPEKSSTLILRKHSYRPITTRKYYPGPHQVAIILNGIETKKMDFQLIEQG